MNNMIEPSQQPVPQKENTPTSTDSVIRQPKKSNRKIWIIAGVILVLGILCLCSIICIAIIGAGGIKIANEKPSITSVLDSYIQFMANKDAESAYALFSPRAQRQIPQSKLQEMLEGNNYIVFEDYQNLSVTTYTISVVANTNPNLPQGNVSKVSGTIHYKGDIQGTFNGTLEKVGDKWMIDGIYVTVPPSKIK
jgi:hypothetical protein